MVPSPLAAFTAMETNNKQLGVAGCARASYYSAQLPWCQVQALPMLVVCSHRYTANSFSV